MAKVGNLFSVFLIDVYKGKFNSASLMKSTSKSSEEENVTSKRSVELDKIDSLIVKLLTTGCGPSKGLTKTVSENEIIGMCRQAMDAFLSQSTLLELVEPIRI